MTADQYLQIAATLLGPTLAAEPVKAEPTEIAKRLFELADAIQTEVKLRTPARQSTFEPLRI